MKVKVKAFLTIRQAMGGEGFVELEMESATPRKVFQALTRKYGRNFKEVIYEPGTNEVWKHNQILVSGRHYAFLPGGLDTVLKDGDVISLIPPIAGG